LAALAVSARMAVVDPLRADTRRHNSLLGRPYWSGQTHERANLLVAWPDYFVRQLALAQRLLASRYLLLPHLA
jgi:hypothetical protein